MSSERFQFTVKIICPVCEQAGEVVWEENSGTAPNKAAKRLVQVSAGFHVEAGRTRSGDPLIVCGVCDQILEDWSGIDPD